MNHLHFEWGISNGIFLMTQKGKVKFFFLSLKRVFFSIFEYSLTPCKSLTWYNHVCAKIRVNALIEVVHVTGRTVEIDKNLVRIYKNIVSFIKIN